MRSPTWRRWCSQAAARSGLVWLGRVGTTTKDPTASDAVCPTSYTFVSLVKPARLKDDTVEYLQAQNETALPNGPKAGNRGHSRGRPGPGVLASDVL